MKLAANTAKEGEAVIATRIGINTARVFFGNLGGEQKLDLTFVGHGVNFAARLEAACEIFHVMVGSTTYELLPNDLQNSKGFNRQVIKVKHHKELVEAFQYNPVADEIQLLDAALEGYRKSLGIRRIEQRWEIANPEKLFRVNDMPARLVNFSLSGLAILLEYHYLGRNVAVTVEVNDKSSPLAQLLNEAKLLPLKGEVRWSRPIEGGYLHGLFFESLNDTQKKHLFEVIKSELYQKEQSATLKIAS